MNKRIFASLAVLLLGALALGACQGAAPLVCEDELGCVELGPDDPVHLAYMLSVTGATAPLGEDARGGAEIALNDRPTVLEHEITFTGEDSGCSAEGGQTAATRLAADPTIVAIIGSTCSSEAIAGLPTISEAGMLMCSPSNTSPRLTDPADAWLAGYYRSAHNDKFQGKIAAEYAFNELGATTAATIHDGSPYADSLQQVFAETFQELGGTITFQGAVNVGDTDMRTILTSVAADSPDVLFFPIFEPEGPFIVAQSSEIAGLEETILFAADGLFADTFPENVGENALGMFMSGPYVTGPDYEALLVKWSEQIGGVPPSGYHAFAYDCVNMILDAIEASAQVGDDGSVLIGRQALREALTATTGFDGLTGQLDCGETGDCATGEALGVYEITEAELNDNNWPPEAIWP